MAKNLTEAQVINSLSRKFDVQVKGKQVLVLKRGKGDLGNGSWGKIDFLKNYCGYTVVTVDEFPDQQRRR